MKLTLFALLFCLLFTSCVTTAPPQPTLKTQSQAVLDRQQREPKEFKRWDRKVPDFYLKRSPWDSPFNPHEVLRYWTKLSVIPISPNTALARMGNPKIDWKNVNKVNDPFKLRIPEGEFASAIFYIFGLSKLMNAELVGYGYRARDGVINFYEWNNDEMKYIREIFKPVQSSA